MKKENLIAFGILMGQYALGVMTGIPIGQMISDDRNRRLRSENEVLKENLEIKTAEADANFKVMRARIHDLKMNMIFENRMLMHLQTIVEHYEDFQDDMFTDKDLERMKELIKELKHQKEVFEKTDLCREDRYGRVVREKYWYES